MIRTVKRKTFYKVLIFLLLSPLLLKSELLLFGQKTKGVAMYNITRSTSRGSSNYTLVQFKVGEKTYDLLGPQNILYEEGEKFTVLYIKEKPSKNMIYTFSNIYLTFTSVIPCILLLIWITIYLTFGEHVVKARAKREMDK